MPLHHINSLSNNKSIGILKILLNQLVKFGAVGIITTILGLSTYYIFIELYNYNVYLVYTITNIVLIYFSYYFNTKYTFSSKTSLSDTFRFYLIHSFGLTISLSFIYFCDKINLSTDFIHCVLAVPIRVTIIFILVKLFLYKSRENSIPNFD